MCCIMSYCVLGTVQLRVDTCSLQCWGNVRTMFGNAWACQVRVSMCACLRQFVIAAQGLHLMKQLHNGIYATPRMRGCLRYQLELAFSHVTIECDACGSKLIRTDSIQHPIYMRLYCSPRPTLCMTPVRQVGGCGSNYACHCSSAACTLRLRLFLAQQLPHIGRQISCE